MVYWVNLAYILIKSDVFHGKLFTIHLYRNHKTFMYNEHN
jgi:hypothetical protein